MNEIEILKKDSVSVDTGALIEYLENSLLGKAFSREVFENPKIKKYYIRPLVDTELKYIFCR